MTSRPETSSPETSRTDPAPASVVVGINDAPDTERGPELSWSAAEADRRHVPLHLVHAVHPRLAALADDPSVTADDDRAALPGRLAADVLARARACVRRQWPQLTITTASAVGSPARLLLDEARDAALLVIGSRGHGQLRGMLSASVGFQLAGHVDCPLVVVPAQPNADTGRLVVGIDTSSASDRVLAYAFEEASRRHATLAVVHAAGVPTYGWGAGVPVVIDWDQLEAEMSDSVEECLAPWLSKYPDVVVRRVLAHGEPLPALLDEARQADLLIVGSRGRGGFASLALGSVSHAVLHATASTPVAVVATRRAGGR